MTSYPPGMYRRGARSTRDQLAPRVLYLGMRSYIQGLVYGGKLAGADYWKHMRACMTNLDFSSYQGDQDVLRRPRSLMDLIFMNIAASMLMIAL